VFDKDFKDDFLIFLLKFLLKKISGVFYSIFAA